MNQIHTTIYLDRESSAPHIISAFAAAFGASPSAIHLLDRRAFEEGSWIRLSPGVQVDLIAELIPGEFPLALDIRTNLNVDMREVLGSIARQLGAVILTDAIAVDPQTSTWLAIGPTGSAVVEANPDAFWSDEPALILEPTSLPVYQSLRLTIPAA